MSVDKSKPHTSNTLYLYIYDAKHTRKSHLFGLRLSKGRRRQKQLGRGPRLHPLLRKRDPPVGRRLRRDAGIVGFTDTHAEKIAYVELTLVPTDNDADSSEEISVFRSLPHL